MDGFTANFFPMHLGILRRTYAQEHLSAPELPPPS
jgi:hypothetical protein